MKGIMSKFQEIQDRFNDSQEDGSWLADRGWLINRVKKLETALQSLADYQFGIHDNTGRLVVYHCKEALKDG